MSRAARLARAAAGSVLARDGGLLQVLRAEIRHELSSQPSTQSVVPDRKPVPFAVEWDEPRTRDVVLRRRYGSSPEEEIAVSALLGPMIGQGEDLWPGNVFMKVCVKKGGLNRVLRFDCEVWEDEENSQFAVRRISCLPLAVDPAEDPGFRRLLCSNPKDKLQSSIKEYLDSRGINHELVNYLLCHLREKEQGQYLSWLRKLEETLAEGL